MVEDESLSLFQSQDQFKPKTSNKVDQGINDLADNVMRLQGLLKQMNGIVYEQGQVVDRIDFNIDNAISSVKKGKQHLVKVGFWLTF